MSGSYFRFIYHSHRYSNHCSVIRFAFVDSRLPTAEPKIAFCPSFFENDPETKDDLDSKKFTANLDHWCKQADHVFGDMITAGHTVLHEVTHLAFILRHAVEAAVDGLSKEVAEQMASVFKFFLLPPQLTVLQ